MTQHFFRPSGSVEGEQGASGDGELSHASAPGSADTQPPVRRFFSNPAMAFAHVFVWTLEFLLLGVQFVRMEELAFDFLPGTADYDLGIMYGSHAVGIVWVMTIVLVSYLTWYNTVLLLDQGREASSTLKAKVLAYWAGNFGVMYFEFICFWLLVEDLDIVGGALAAKLFGILMVFTHQVACHWIVSGLVRRREASLNGKEI
ncbi:MAG: hypothetical protein ACQEVT_18705 [Pseudomonadota bacterium]